jgi:hypothetical protein
VDEALSYSCVRALSYYIYSRVAVRRCCPRECAGCEALELLVDEALKLLVDEALSYQCVRECAGVHARRPMD